MLGQKLPFDDSRADLSISFGGLGVFFEVLAALQTGLKISFVQGHPGDPEWHQKIEGRSG